MLEVWTIASVLQGGFYVIIDCWGNFFGCFEGNFENTGRMEMFSMPGESDLVELSLFITLETTKQFPSTANNDTKSTLKHLQLFKLLTLNDPIQE